MSLSNDEKDEIHKHVNAIIKICRKNDLSDLYFKVGHAGDSGWSMKLNNNKTEQVWSQ